MGSLRSLKSKAESAKVDLVTDVALIDAIKSGAIRQVEILLKQGANPYAGDWVTGNALEHALHKDDLRMAELLVSYMPDVNHRDWLGHPALHQAILSDSCMAGAICLFLLDHGADVNAVDSTGWTALMTAVHSQHFDIARLLLRRGADATLRDRDGYRALDHLPRARGSKEFRKLLEKVS